MPYNSRLPGNKRPLTIVKDPIHVAFPRLQLDSESSGVSRRICATRLSSYSLSKASADSVSPPSTVPEQYDETGYPH